MTRNKKAIILVLIAIMVSGIYAGMNFYENKVNRSIAEIIASSDALSVESFSFSLPSRRLIAKNVSYSIKNANIMDTKYHYEEIDIVFTWGFLFHDGSPGVVAVADSLLFKNATVKTDSNVINYVITAGLFSYFDIKLDTSLFENILLGKNVLDNYMALSETFECSLTKSEDTVLTGDSNSIFKLSVGTMEIRDVKGLQFSLFSLNDLTVNYGATEKKLVPVFGIQTFSIADLKISPELGAFLNEIKSDTVITSSIERKFMEILGNSTTPIIKNMTISNAWSNINDLPIKLNSYVFNWDSISPLQISIAGEISIPSESIEHNLDFALPLLETVTIDFSTILDEDKQGKIQKSNVLEVENLGRLEMNTAITIAKSDTDEKPSIAFTYDLISKGKIDKIYFKYVDEGMLSYLLLNADIKNSEDAASLLMFLPMQFPNISKETIASLASFIKKPGTLEITLNLEQPLPYNKIVGSIAKQNINVNVTQGEKTLDESLDILYKAE